MFLSRLLTHLRRLSTYSQQTHFNFSSSSTAAKNPRSLNFFSGESGGGSSVYRHALMFQKPTTVKFSEVLYNSVSFIGAVCYPPKSSTMKDGRVSAYTRIGVPDSGVTNRKLWVLIEMRDKLAEISSEHLKTDDLIYVSGLLQSYVKVNENGQHCMQYKVIVHELNYVTQSSKQPTIKKFDKKVSEEGQTSLEKYRNRLHLWQMVFSNPNEWWDNRKNKTHPNQPDFKHKDTGESLWLKPDDPSWIERQLQLYDSRMGVGGHRGYEDLGSIASTWMCDE